MKKLLLFVAIVLSTHFSYAQQFPTFDWARVANESYPSIPSVGTNYGSSIRLIKRDAAGNIYIAGDLNKAMVFNGLNIYGQNFYQEGNMYLMKLNPTGETIHWVKTMNGGGINNFTIDTDGFLYCNGAMGDYGIFKYGAATIAGGTTYPNIIPDDAIFFKVNANNGDLVWVKNASNQDNYSNYPLIQTDANAIYATDGLGLNASNSTTPRGYRIIKILKSIADADPDNFIETTLWALDKPWVKANIDPLYENHIFDMKLTNDKQSLWVYLMTGDVWIDDFSNQQYDTRDMILVRLDNLNNTSPTVGFMKKFTSLIPLNPGDLQIDSQGNIIITGSFRTDPNRYTSNANGKAE
ncbi:hypothetical protein EGI22_15285, partial [Lacihabitans sp. LS3-19]|uniref:hypothetical protein n=1 Tax=Lacihabitans sp. LS3-19 TaxID=2487335 RepID=UPI0020CD44FD